MRRICHKCESEFIQVGPMIPVNAICPDCDEQQPPYSLEEYIQAIIRAEVAKAVEEIQKGIYAESLKRFR